MGKLIYSSITSLDGYIADTSGNFDWSAPDEEVHAFVNALMRPATTHLYGRRIYDVLQAWETMGTSPDEPEVIREFGEQWRAAEKIVYSRTLTSVSTSRTRVENDFDADEVIKLKASTVGDLIIGGPEIAAHALRDGLVDEVHVFINPVVVGGGTPFLPDGYAARLQLIDEHRFTSGVVHLGFRVIAELAG